MRTDGLGGVYSIGEVARAAGVSQAQAPAPKAEKKGRDPIATPIDVAPAPPQPTPRLLSAQPLPSVIAPIVSAPNDERTRSGLLEQIAAARDDSGGSGRGRGAGTGTGS